MKLIISTAVLALINSSHVYAIGLNKEEQIQEPVARSSKENHDIVEIEKKVAKTQGITHALAEHGDSSDDDDDKTHGKTKKKSVYNAKSPKP